MIMDATYSLIALYISALQQNKPLRFRLIIAFGILFLVSIILIFTAEFFIYPVAAGLRQLTPIISVVFGALFLLSLLSFAPIKIKSVRSFDFDFIESIRQERKEIEQRISENPRQDISSTIQLSLNQLTEYYAINKSQARSSFGWSIFAMIVGLVTLIGGIWLFYLRDTPNLQLTAITGVASILAEFIGAAYFFLYNKTLNQLNLFYAQLVRLQDTMLSIKLMEDIKESSKQTGMREKLITTLINHSIYNSQHATSIKQAKIN